MKAPYNTNLSFKNLFNQIEEAIFISEVTDTPYTPRQVVIAAYKVLYHAGIFEDECKVWRKNNNKCTWATTKKDFGNAHQNMIINLNTASGADYHNPKAANNTAAEDYCHGKLKHLPIW